MADLWLDVEKKLEGSPKLCEVYNIAKKEHLKEYMDKISRNEMATGSRRILDNISKFVDKYAPIAEIIKSMDDRHHNAQLGYGIFTLLWLMTGATTSYSIYMENQLKRMSKSLQDMPRYEFLWYGGIDDSEMLTRIYDVYEAFLLFVADCYKHYSSGRIARALRSIFLTKNILEDKTSAFNDAVRRVLDHSRMLHEKHEKDQEENNLQARRDKTISRITRFVNYHESCQTSEPEKYLGSIQQNEEPSEEQDDPYAPERGEVSSLNRFQKFKWWDSSPGCAMLLLKAQNARGTEPWEPLWISGAIAKYTCGLDTATNHTRVIFRAVEPGEDISGFLASIITSILRWNLDFFKRHAQRNTELLKLRDIINEGSHGTQDKTRALLEPMKSLLQTWLQEFPGSTITIIACDFHNYAQHWSDKDKRPQSTLVDVIDALLQLMSRIHGSEGWLKVCLVVKAHAWPETLQDKIDGQCGQHTAKLDRFLRVEEMAQGQRGFIG